MNPPDDIGLPFFAYGLFKPGQLCYSRIRDNGFSAFWLVKYGQLEKSKSYCISSPQTT
jgi:hypothetical protein